MQGNKPTIAAKSSIKETERFGDIPGGPEVKNSLCNAGDMGSIAGWRTEIPFDFELLSPHTLEPMDHNLRAHAETTGALGLWSALAAATDWRATIESLCAATKHLTRCNEDLVLQLRPIAAK